jgi:hypothetical protein
VQKNAPARHITALVAAAVIAIATVAGCSGGSGASTAPTEPLTIEQAIASGPGGPVTVRGYIVAPAGEPTMLCSALLESYPPQCGRPSLALEGLDLSTVDGLTGPSDPSLAQVQWTDSEISLLGSLEDATLVVDQPSG